MTPIATILIPTHDHGPTLRASVASALRQTVPVEVFVIGDGTTDETREIMAEIADARMRFFDHPKGPRHGEVYRHEALKEAQGRIVCYLSDDDLYLPRHVEEMSRLLEDADFAHAVAVRVGADGGMVTLTVNLALAVYQRELLEGRNRIPLSAGAHTLAMYRTLVEGWTSAPPGTPTDLHMWQKFLRHPGCRFRASQTPTVLVFPATYRPSVPPADRLEELRDWTNRTTGDEQIAALNTQILAQKIGEAAELDGRLVGAVLDGGAVLKPDRFQIYFPDADGYREQNSASFPVEFSTWQKISFEVPPHPIDLPIRVDPATQPCLIELANIRLCDADGAVLWGLTESNASQLKVAGTAVTISRGRVVQLLSDGDDPQVLLPLLEGRSDQDKVRLEAMVRLNANVLVLAQSFGKYLRIPDF